MKSLCDVEGNVGKTLVFLMIQEYSRLDYKLLFAKLSNAHRNVTEVMVQDGVMVAWQHIRHTVA